MIDSDDSVGQGITAPNAGWSFGGSTAGAFPEHIRRSVPFYDEGHDLICQLSDFFVRDDSTAYDVGMSVGELLAKLAARRSDRGQVRWIGIDVEPEMVGAARQTLTALPGVVTDVGDVVTYEFEQCDFVVAYYCLQFIAPKHRQEVLTKIYDALAWGGALIWFEKVRGSDARFQDIFTLLYADFKLEQRFSPAEIIAKSRSLKGVLEPFSTEGNRGMLQRAGFTDVVTVFKYLCFEGVLAIK